ncbi:MAG: hypothetical protein AB7S59_26355, partial [Parvibaculaceae bacterium]
KSVFALAVIAATALAPLALAGEAMSPEKFANLRMRVETATALAAIAEHEKDGDMMLVAAKLLSTVGPVEKRGQKTADGKAEHYDVKKMVEQARSMGAKPDEKSAKLAMSPKAGMVASYCAIGAWIHTCDYSGYCRWEYQC